MAAIVEGAGSVDVVIAAWNRADTIERAVLSALRQSEVRTVFVIDDCSTDDTAARAMEAGSSSDRVVVRILPENRGPSAARNQALAMSSAPWVAILDGDDFFLPGRIETLLAFADEADFIADNILLIDESQIGEANGRSRLLDLVEPRRLNFGDFVRGNTNLGGARRRELGFLKQLIRRSFLDRHALTYDENLRLGEDYALYAQALAIGARFVVSPNCGYAAALRADSLSGAHSRKDLERLRDVDRTLAALPGLSRADRRALASHYIGVDARVRWLSVIDGYKLRSPAQFLSPFFAPPMAAAFLFRQLLAEGARRLPIASESRSRPRLGAGRRPFRAPTE